MRWSKLRQVTERRFADVVRGRVELRTTRYAKAHDEFGRSWITIDGREVVNMSIYYDLRGRPADGDPARFAADVFVGGDLPAAMRAFASLSVAAALASSDPLVRGLAVLDGRLGRRRLARLDPAGEPSPLVAELLAFRRSAEAGRSLERQPAGG